MYGSSSNKQFGLLTKLGRLCALIGESLYPTPSSSVQGVRLLILPFNCTSRASVDLYLTIELSRDFTATHLLTDPSFTTGLHIPLTNSYTGH